MPGNTASARQLWTGAGVIVLSVWLAGSSPPVLLQQPGETHGRMPAGIASGLNPVPGAPLSEINWTGNVAEKDLHAIYERIRGSLQAIYMKSGDPVAAVYQHWKRYNRVPYMSPVEGISFRNNYANRIARAYGTPGLNAKYPAGAILAKDSFVVTEAGELFPGPLSLMEKMPTGFNADTHDWRFTQVEPDGSVLGTTNGKDASKVLFCIGCHVLAGTGQDYVFRVPEKFRALSREE